MIRLPFPPPFPSCMSAATAPGEEIRAVSAGMNTTSLLDGTPPGGAQLLAMNQLPRPAFPHVLADTLPPSCREVIANTANSTARGTWTGNNRYVGAAPHVLRHTTVRNANRLRALSIIAQVAGSGTAV